MQRAGSSEPDVRFFYSLHGRVLAADCPLPLLGDAPAAADPELILRLTSPAGPRSGVLWHRGEGALIERTPEDELILRFEDGTEFLVGSRGTVISLLTAPTAYTRDDLLAYALGPVLTVALHLQGAVLLHASAAVIGTKVVLFSGTSGSGKSTIAAMLHRLGYPVLSDDVTEVRGGRAIPSTEALRLWPDVLERLFGPASAYPDRAPSWDKKVLRLTATDVRPHQIGAILFLERREGGARLERLAARDGWLRLVAEAPAARLPGPDMERTIFEVTAALADRVPMFTFSPPPLEHAASLGEFLESRLGEWLR